MPTPISFFDLTQPPLSDGSLPPPPEEWDPSCRFVEDVRKYILEGPSAVKSFYTVVNSQNEKPKYKTWKSSKELKLGSASMEMFRWYFEENFPHVWIVGGPIMGDPAFRTISRERSGYTNKKPPSFDNVVRESVDVYATTNPAHPSGLLTKSSTPNIIFIPLQLFTILSKEPTGNPSITRPQALEIFLRQIFHELALALGRHFSTISGGGGGRGRVGWEIEAAFFGSWLKVEWRAESRGRLNGIEKLYLTVASKGTTIVLDHSTHLLWSQTLLCCLTSVTCLTEKPADLLQRLQKLLPEPAKPLSSGYLRDRTSNIFFAEVETGLADGFPVPLHVARSRSVGREPEAVHLFRLTKLSAGLGEGWERFRFLRERGFGDDESVDGDDAPFYYQFDFLGDDSDGEGEEYNRICTAAEGPGEEEGARRGREEEEEGPQGGKSFFRRMVCR